MNDFKEKLLRFMPIWLWERNKWPEFLMRDGVRRVIEDYQKNHPGS